MRRKESAAFNSALKKMQTPTMRRLLLRDASAAVSWRPPFCPGLRSLVAIGPYTLRNPVVLAPMAGVTDLPFRELVWELGAGLVVAEMTSVNPQLWSTRTSLLRRERGTPRPRVVQIAGADPALVATAATLAVADGAEIVDVNMGCPAKKVCNQAAGSALLRDEALVARILERVVGAVNVPVTLKIRTGWSPEHRNGVTIAKIAEASGVLALAVHGRTRACMFRGDAEHETVRAIKAAVKIPVFANGDIDSPERAREIFQATGVDGVMIGRGAQGRPWIFREVNFFLA